MVFRRFGGADAGDGDIIGVVDITAGGGAGAVKISAGGENVMVVDDMYVRLSACDRDTYHILMLISFAHLLIFTTTSHLHGIFTYRYLWFEPRTCSCEKSRNLEHVWYPFWIRAASQIACKVDLERCMVAPQFHLWRIWTRDDTELGL